MQIIYCTSKHRIYRIIFVDDNTVSVDIHEETELQFKQSYKIEHLWRNRFSLTKHNFNDNMSKTKLDINGKCIGYYKTKSSTYRIIRTDDIICYDIQFYRNKHIDVINGFYINYNWTTKLFLSEIQLNELLEAY